MKQQRIKYMERETVKFTTKSGKNTVEYYAYATGREARAINSKIISSVKMSLDGDKPMMDGINFGTASEADDDKIKLLVVSFNDSKDNILDRILDLPQGEYAEIQKVLDAVVSKKN